MPDALATVLLMRRPKMLTLRFPRVSESRDSGIAAFLSTKLPARRIPATSIPAHRVDQEADGRIRHSGQYCPRVGDHDIVRHRHVFCIHRVIADAEIKLMISEIADEALASIYRIRWRCPFYCLRPGGRYR